MVVHPHGYHGAVHGPGPLHPFGSYSVNTSISKASLMGLNPASLGTRSLSPERHHSLGTQPGSATQVSCWDPHRFLLSLPLSWSSKPFPSSAPPSATGWSHFQRPALDPSNSASGPARIPEAWIHTETLTVWQVTPFLNDRKGKAWGEKTLVLPLTGVKNIKRWLSLRQKTPSMVSGCLWDIQQETHKKAIRSPELSG